MSEVALAFGRGAIKILISLFVGSGVGLVTFGYYTKDKPEFWRQPDPGGELFLAIGVGLLTSGVLLGGLFTLPKLAQRTATTGKPARLDD